MAGRPRVVATGEQREELRALAGSRDREEADRARAILLSLEGWSSARIAEAKADSVRHWRWTFGAPIMATLRACPGALDFAEGRLIVQTSRTKRSGDFIALLSKLDDLYGPRPARPSKPVVLVADNGPIHISKASCAALDARPWLTIEWLPNYAPELNDIENSWRDLKRHFLAHQTFRDLDHLDQAIHAAVESLNRERQNQMCANLRIAA